MFKSIVFKNNNIKKNHFEYVKSRNILKQYPNSMINYYSELNDNSRIFIDYVVEGNLKPYVEITFDSGQKQKINLPPKESKMGIDLSMKNARMAKISLVVLGENRGSRVTWKSLKIHHPQENNSLSDKQSIKKDRVKGTKRRKDNKPDILLYVVDALRSDHLSCYGYSRQTSPNLDSFAKNSSLFINCYANSSWTKSSAATILTGLLPENHKTMSRDSSLPRNLQTLAELLKDNGYYTIAFITNHNINEDFCFDQGFDNSIFLPENLLSKSVYAKSDELNKYVFAFFDKFLGVKNRKPFFAFIWSMDPHNPYTPDRSVSGKFGIGQYEPIDANFGLLSKFRRGSLVPTESQLQYVKALYDQEIFFNDKSFGSLLKEMKQRDIYKDSVIIFTADQGEEFRDHGGYGHGLTLYNEVIRIPLVIKSNRIKKGEKDFNVQHTDIFPTILDILDIEPACKPDGDSLLKAENLENRYIISQEKLDLNDVYSFLSGRYKLVYNVESNRPPIGRMVVPRYELYDNRIDMLERFNLADKMEVKTGYLGQMLRAGLAAKDKGLVAQAKKVTIDPELDRKLRDLGYVR